MIMKKITVVALAFCLVAAFTASVWAADIPGQKLTQDEMSSITGKASPFTIPMSFFQNLSPSGVTVFINGQKATANSPSYTVSTIPGVTVTASATFRK
jgi:hypothetical protein